MSRTVKYQEAFSRIVGSAGKRFLFSSPPPPSIFLLPLQLSRYNSTGNACHAGYCGLYFITHARWTLKRKQRVCEQAKNSCQYEISKRSVSWKRDLQVTSQRKRARRCTFSTRFSKPFGCGDHTWVVQARWHRTCTGRWRQTCSCNEHERYTQRFLLSFNQRSLHLPNFLRYVQGKFTKGSQLHYSCRK